jgi:hypothetical protein
MDPRVKPAGDDRKLLQPPFDAAAGLVVFEHGRVDPELPAARADVPRATAAKTPSAGIRSSTAKLFSGPNRPHPASPENAVAT